MNRRTKLVWGVLGIWIAVGVVVTVWDYRIWRYEETKNYGHGPDVEKATWKLIPIYQNNPAGVRIRYPEGWTAETTAAFRNEQQLNWPGDGRVAEFSLKETASLPAGRSKKITIDARKIGGSLTDWENKFLADADPTGRSYGDRQVVNADRGSYSILTWQSFSGNETFMRQLGLAKKGELLVMMEMKSGLVDFKIDEVNFREMMKSLVLL